MAASAADLLNLFLFLALGVGLKKGGILKENDFEGLKKIILNIAIPAVLYLSFAKIDFNPGFIPVIAAIFGINFILFWFGILLFKLTGSRNRILPLILSTMNFAFVGIPLYEAVFGIDQLHHYTMFGVGNELYVWFVFNFLFRWFLARGGDGKRKNTGVLKSPIVKSPIVWGIILGCLAGILKFDITSSGNFIIKGITKTLEASSLLTTPLILIYLGHNISLKLKYLKQSMLLVLLRLVSLFGLGYLVKITVIDQFIVSSVYYNAAFFLLMTLPAIFALPVLSAGYLDDEETAVLNNTIVLHSVVTTILFSLYSIILIP